MKILKWLAFPFVWLWNDVNRNAEDMLNETDEEWLDRQW